MLFRVAAHSDLSDLFNRLAADYSLVGPVTSGSDRNGNPLSAFKHVSNFNDLQLDYSTTTFSAKQYFLPFREELARFRIDGAEWNKTATTAEERPTAIFGLHACDINALNKLDKVLMGSVYPVPSYAAKRKRSFIIGMNCKPGPSCFCRSMGADTALSGFDLFITDIGNRYFIEILSAAAYDILRGVNTRAPEEADHERYMQVVEEKHGMFTTQVDTGDLTKILDMEFQSSLWKEWGDRCLGCGTCANVCPTCYCYGVEENVDVNLTHAAKTKTLYSCNLLDFAEVAGGHNFRPERSTRLKYRYYHKHRGFVETYEESLCVGCGRCGNACLSGITPPEVIASIRHGGH